LSNKDHYIKVLDTNIRYRIYDNGGPYIILLHSFGGNLNLWEPVAKRIKCGRIITLDLIGFGMSVSDVENFSLDSHSRYLIAFMDALDINSACLVGSSMGASIAAWTASKRPERVNRVVLFAPSGFPGSMRHTWPLDLIYRPGILNRFIDAIAKSSIFKFFFPQSLAQQALEVTASYDFSFVEALMKIKQPVDLVWSPEDKRVSFLYVQDYRKLISQATLYMASAGSGHEAAFLEPNFSARLIANGIED
jgi:pimeloyl-ACP methyl ester carboxylesterase